jgi:hypothetical protein
MIKEIVQQFRKIKVREDSGSGIESFHNIFRFGWYIDEDVYELPLNPRSFNWFSN